MFESRLSKLFALTALTVSTVFTSLSASAAVTIENAMARATFPMAKTGAVYMTISNDSTQDIRLVQAVTDASIAASVELHTVIKDGEVMKMREVKDGIPVPAEGQVMLKPGGYHIMLIDLVSGLEVGEEVKLSLTFSDGTTNSVIAPVKTVDKTMNHHHHH